jgi:hypothetical protein
MNGTKIAILAASVLALLGLAGPASALADPVLDVNSSHIPPGSQVPAGTYAKYTLVVSNTGTTETTGNVTVHFSVPAGLEVTGASGEEPFGFHVWDCSTPTQQSAECVGPELAEFSFPIPIKPGEEACENPEGELFSVCHVFFTVKADSSASPGTVHPTTEVSGGGDLTPATADDPIDIGPPPHFDLTAFDGGVLEENGDAATQAGSRPHTAFTEFNLSSQLAADGSEFSTDDLQNVITKLPPGLLGNPTALETCTEAQLQQDSEVGCPPGSQVGEAFIELNGSYGSAGHLGHLEAPVYNMKTPHGTPALLAFNILNVVVQVYAKVRSGEDYGATVLVKDSPQTFPIAGSRFKVWGVPADHSHDAERRGSGCPSGCSSPDAAEPAPFFTLPTSCVGPVETFLTVTGWQGGEASASFLSHASGEPLNTIGTTGCNAVDFSPTLEARPTTNLADSASGLDVDLHVPQHEVCDPGPPVTCENAEATLKDTTVTLPEGMVVNPSGANGLGACSQAQFGFTAKEGDVIHTTPDPATCPDSAKLGTVEVDSPLVDHPLQGAAYIAQPYQNPFNSLLALYITVDDPQTGVVVKLAGEIHADPSTGRLTTTFLHNPQLPFEDFRLHFFGGAGGSLRTPATCGTYTTTSSLTPWSAPESGPPATPQDPWAISQAPGGGTCPTSSGAQPNSPDLDAGSVSPIAAAYSPTVVTLRRNDGSQEFSTVNLTLPPGMTGRLAGIPACSDAALAAAASKAGNQEKASPSCPPASQIGSVDVAAGAGPAPYHAQGIAYLTGPYKGAPLGMAIVTPATAGPFDLGTVVVRVALHVDPSTARITAVSDPIPSVLQGIPLDVRSAQVKLDRPNFTLNGTSCDPSAFSGQLVSTLSQIAPLSERFQLGECSGLSFKPKVSIRLTGGTKRGSHPALRGVLTMPPGGANVARASFALPHSEFLDQAHIGTVCTRVQFAADECPAASVYGHATALSPLVDYAVEGPVYLRSSSNKLPDLVMALHGPPSQPVEVDAVARIDSIKGGIRSTFEGVPDLPLSTVVLEMEGGKKGLLQNSTNICKGIHKATAELDAQNGKTADLAPALKNGKCGKAKPRRHGRRGAR